MAIDPELEKLLLANLAAGNADPIAFDAAKEEKTKDWQPDVNSKPVFKSLPVFDRFGKIIKEAVLYEDEDK